MHCVALHRVAWRCTVNCTAVNIANKISVINSSQMTLQTCFGLQRMIYVAIADITVKSCEKYSFVINVQSSKHV